MFLRSLEVQNFRALREARLTFTRGLNVLYGPNDLGKSSLAEALRVAFLLPVTSSACSNFVPWGTKHAPRVVVKFEMKNVVWQITKAFGPGGKGTALLERFGEGGGLSEEARGREVEGRLREIVAWGVPAPGKGAPRGLPENYLSTALLGLQGDVTAILAASPGPVDSGLELVTKALGALGQDPLVSQLLQRLQELTEKVFTEGGQVRKAEDSPLVQLTKKVKDKKERLDKLEESVRQSGEIEEKVQSLLQHRFLAAEECSRLERRVGLLRRVRRAEEELEIIRDREQAIEEARRVLAGIETDLLEKERRHREATTALSNIEVDLRTARERQAKLSGSWDKVRENAQYARDARRAELVATRDAAAGRAQSARDAIQAREQVQGREREVALAEGYHEQAQQAEVRAQSLAELANLLAQQQQSKAVVETWRVATKECDDRAIRVTEAEAELKKSEAALANAEAAAKSQTDALAAAQREAAQRDLRKITLRTSLIRVETAEREALADHARANDAMACSARLIDAVRSLTELEAEERDLETKLAANAAEKEAYEAKRTASMPLPMQAALLIGILGGAIAAVLGIGLQFPGWVLAVSIVGSSLLAAGVAAFVLRHRKVRGAIRLLRREIDDLANAREKLLERRNLVLAKRGVAQLRVDTARSDRDRAVGMVGELEGAVAKAGSRVQEAREELKRIRSELATIEGLNQIHDGIACEHVEAAERAVVRLKEQVLEKKRLLDEARQRRSEAQVRLEAAECSAVLVNLADLEQRVNAARMKAGGGLVSDPEEAQTRLRSARQTAAELDTAMKVARGRLADARSRFEGMTAALGQPADVVLAEAEKMLEEADKALEGLEETSATEVAAAEEALLEAQADVDRLGGVQTAAQAKVEAATQARDQAWTNREQSRAKLEALLPSVANATLIDAQTALAQARRELESDSGGSTSLPDNVAAAEALLEVRQAELRTTDIELQEVRGQLKFVGGAVARDQHDLESQAHEGLKKCAEELELEYRATKRLLDVLKEEEMKHAAHLGRSLAKPVTEIFSAFTSSRYPQIVLDPSLRFQSVMAKGGERDLASLSVGTRDQLATLVRLALAAQLKSVVVLDDQLVQSDPNRVAWFRDRLRASVQQHEHQIIVITCRPLDYLRPEEMPAPPRERLESLDGRLAAVDLERLISCG